MYELACILYEKSLRMAGAYKINEEKWWYIPKHDVRECFKDPKEEKISDRRKLYYFEFQNKQFM